MIDTTSRLGMPMLQAGEAQKEVLHNEALLLIDALLPGLVDGMADLPPPQPGEGVWIVGAAASGAWAGHAGEIAVASAGGWRFIVPPEGLRLRMRGSGYPVERIGGGWRTGRLDAASLFVDGMQVVGSQRPAIADPTGGAVIDTEGRRAVADILVALRSHGIIAS